MPVFIAYLLGGLINIAGTLAGRVLIGLGISLITYSGVSTSLQFLQSGAIASFSGLPSNVLGLMAVLKVGECISMVFSAITVRLTLQGLSSGSFKRWVHS